MYGLLSGAYLQNSPILSTLLMKRISLIGSNLRHRSDDFKSDLVEKFNKKVFPLLASKEVMPIVDRVFKVDLSDAKDVA